MLKREEPLVSGIGNKPMSIEKATINPTSPKSPTSPTNANENARKLSNEKKKRENPNKPKPGSNRAEFLVFPQIDDEKNSEKDKLRLFLKKVEQCNILFDFGKAEENIKGKEAKRVTLEEIIEYVGRYGISRSELVYSATINMVSNNMFRDLSPQADEVNGGTGINGGGGMAEAFDEEDDMISEVTYCTVQFIEKEPALSTEIVFQLLKYWPKTNSSKEVMYLNEIEEILEVVTVEEFETFHCQLFSRLSKCIVSPQFQVAERAFSFWRNDHIIQLINMTLEAIMPIVLKEVFYSCKSHWNSNIHHQANAVYKYFMLSDQLLFERCIDSMRVQYQSHSQRMMDSQKLWETLKQSDSATGFPTIITPISNTTPSTPESTSSDMSDFDVLLERIVKPENLLSFDPNDSNPGFFDQGVGGSSADDDFGSDFLG
ncbi:Serine/threonine-protein phosphatase 2A 56 kDa regulatory subunit delta isoform [Zancudomyces culisetae]|uniref:Serine/threonine-protein phosphatase 2A 56 kDa regulatory subunit delta isoform n=1 Tax=Zancudomyces culisetae TaxID=1213189 RepID=A0A1R1PRC4_ZANCU|nr:Serine/threonine-protein phosphatase 2A 56 kDa regulatory subunit delta isoform [Zancudomyces culisetae]|eukprot:OMH83491.1 Serine/threonine-protein phosphatase 2A 56 kDa regulatory subunit delta isoform [Zancudomyces culisetae]